MTNFFLSESTKDRLLNYLNITIAATILLSQTFRWRFDIGIVPANFLLLYSGLLLVIIWSIYIYNLSPKKTQETDPGKKAWTHFTFPFLSLTLLLSSTASLLSGSFSQNSIGLYLVLFFIPTLLGLGIFANLQRQAIRNYIYFSSAIVFLASGIVSLLQYKYLLFLDPKWWGNAIEPKRSVAFFDHPNAAALFLGPLLALWLPKLYELYTEKKYKLFTLSLLCWILGSVAVGLSLSRAGWLALGVGLVFFMINRLSIKKVMAVSLISLILFCLVYATMPIVRHRISVSLFQDTATSARILLWKSGWKLIEEHPLTGIGAGGYKENFDRLDLPNTIDTHTSPHNVLIHMWIESGLLGAVSFVFLMIFTCFVWLTDRKNNVKLSLVLFILVFFIHGLFDIAYFRNDLSLIFWLITAAFLQTPGGIRTTSI